MKNAQLGKQKAYLQINFMYLFHHLEREKNLMGYIGGVKTTLISYELNIQLINNLLCPISIFCTDIYCGGHFLKRKESIMSIIIAKGNVARSLNTSCNGTSYEMLSMNCRDKRRVMFIGGEEEFSLYVAHTDYDRNIITHPCLAPSGVECPTCQAGIPTRFKTVVLFWDIDRLKILVWDIVKKHMRTIYNLIDKYPTWRWLSLSGAKVKTVKPNMFILPFTILQKKKKRGVKLESK